MVLPFLTVLLSACTITVPNGSNGPTAGAEPQTAPGETDSTTELPPGTGTAEDTGGTNSLLFELDDAWADQEGVYSHLTLTTALTGRQDGDTTVTVECPTCASTAPKVYEVTFVHGVAQVDVPLDNPCAQLPGAVDLNVSLDGAAWWAVHVDFIGVAVSEALGSAIIPDVGPLVVCGSFANASEADMMQIVVPDSGSVAMSGAVYKFGTASSVIEGWHVVTPGLTGVIASGTLVPLSAGNHDVTVMATAGGDYVYWMEAI